jgi:GT2 family glycosyltransferase
MIDLHVVVVSYNTAPLLLDCLASLAESRFPGREVVVSVVDNGSSDGSAEIVERQFPGFRLIRSENRGYAHGNNMALRRVSARYHLLLNPDTAFAPGALAPCLDYMESHPEVGALGVRLVLPDGQLDLACRRGTPTPWNAFARYSGLARLFPRSRLLGGYNLTYLDPDQEADVGSLVGAFMLLREEALAQAGSLDESFFMYGEDLDLCLRLRQLGWAIRYWPEVTVLHHKRAASSKSPRARREFFRAMRIFYSKHRSSPFHFLQRPLVMLGIALVEWLSSWGGML